MDYLIIFLISLKTHFIFYFLIIIALELVAPLILPKKFRLPMLAFSFILFSLCFVNSILGHFLTNFLISKYGTTGQGVVLDISPMSNLNNNEPVLSYNVSITTTDNNEISTYCLTSDFNITNTSSFNQNIYPKPGVKFNVKYIKDYPKAFVIISNDDSEYSRSLDKFKTLDVN